MKKLLSLLKEHRFRRKNKRRLAEEAQQRVYGFSVDSKSLSFEGDRLILRALLNALLMFALVYGLALSFIIPFEIQANKSFLALASALFALFFAMINCKKAWQSIGYILFFVCFTAFLIIFRGYINSGLNGMLNDFYEVVSEKLDFSRIRTYDEAYESQHYMAVTTFFLVIIAAYMLLINFTFNNEQSPMTLLVVIFPFLQMGMYIDIFPGMFTFFLTAMSILITLMLRYNFQHRMPTKKKNVLYFRRKKDIYNLQASSGRVSWQASGYIAGILLVFCLVISVLLPPDSFTPTKEDTALKAETEPVVTRVLMYGLSSLFMNENSAWDDAMGGQLGQVGTVFQDFETDMEVTFTPYQYDTIYLRSSSYSTYLGDHWGKELIDLSNETSFLRTTALLYKDSGNDNTILQGTMKIDLKDYSLFSSDFLPYYGTRSKDDVTVTSSMSRTIEYVVVQDFWNSNYANNTEGSLMTAYDNLCNKYSQSIYGNVDNYSYKNSEYYIRLKAVLDNICEEQGFSGSTEEIIKQIQDYLEKDFVYTLNPGKVPNGEDFATYFLTNSKKGYCTYFATAGCLLLRNMGITARYCEGYALDMSAVIGGETLRDEDYYDWMSGDASVGKTAVVKAPLTDANAHAWCEVYIDGFGWVPVEFTVAGVMDESDKASWAIWDAFENVGSDSDANDTLAGIIGANVGVVFEWIGKLLIALAVLAIPFVIYRIYKWYSLKQKPDTIRYHQTNIRLMKSYQRFLKKLKKKHIITQKNPTPAQVRAALIESGWNTEAADRLRMLYSKAAFSGQEMTKGELSEFTRLLKA